MALGSRIVHDRLYEAVEPDKPALRPTRPRGSCSRTAASSWPRGSRSQCGCTRWGGGTTR